MKAINALVYQDNADADNRFAKIDLDTDFENRWIITLNGTDSNGEYVRPQFVAIDNYNGDGDVTIYIDAISSTIAKFTKVIWQVNPLAQHIVVEATEGVVTIWISEKKLPIGEGINESGVSSLGTNVLRVNSRSGIAALLASADMAAMLTEAGRAGFFVFEAGDQSAFVTADPNQGLYIAPLSDASGASGAWVRQDWDKLDPRWFGALVNDVADDAPAINAAFAIDYALAVDAYDAELVYRGGHPIKLCKGTWYIASSLQPLMTVDLGGEGGKGVAAPTQVRVAPGIDAVILQAYNTSGTINVDVVNHFSGDDDYIHDIAFLGNGGVVVGNEAEANGIRAKRRFTAERCTFIYFEGDGIYCHTSSGGGSPDEGNTNVSRIINCDFRECRNGISTKGGDANAISVIGCSFIYNRHWGVEERGFLGNHYYGHHFDSNAVIAWNTGAANRPCSYCHRTGNQYFCIDGQEVWAAANAPTGAATDNQGWGWYRAGGIVAGGFPDWFAGINVRSGGPYILASGSNASTMEGSHSEDNGYAQIGALGFVSGVTSGNIALVAGGILIRRKANFMRAVSGGMKYGNMIVDGDFTALGATALGDGSANTALNMNGLNSAALNFYSAGVLKAQIYSVTATNGLDVAANALIRIFIGGVQVASYGAAGYDTPGNAFVYKVNGVQVVGPRQTGWAAASNTKLRTTFDTTTVTLPNLAARVGALIDDLMTHGAIGA